MEDTLRVTEKIKLQNDKVVLILVLMEDTLRELSKTAYKTVATCLNPCFNGRYSQRGCGRVTLLYMGLNPCFNGRYSQRTTFLVILSLLLVLILVLMEDTLREQRLMFLYIPVFGVCSSF